MSGYSIWKSPPFIYLATTYIEYIFDKKKFGRERGRERETEGHGRVFENIVKNIARIDRKKREMNETVGSERKRPKWEMSLERSKNRV